MYLKENIELYKKAIDIWGKDLQIDVAIEEMSELIKALIKFKRSDESKLCRQQVLWEIADIYVMLDQLSIMFDTKENPITLDSCIQYKLDRLSERLYETKKNIK